MSLIDLNWSTSTTHADVARARVEPLRLTRDDIGWRPILGLTAVAATAWRASKNKSYFGSPDGARATGDLEDAASASHSRQGR